MSWFRDLAPVIDAQINGLSLKSRAELVETARGVQHLCQNHVQSIASSADAVFMTNGQYRLGQGRRPVGQSPLGIDHPVLNWGDVCTEDGGFEPPPGLVDAVANYIDEAKRLVFVLVNSRNDALFWIARS